MKRRGFLGTLGGGAIAAGAISEAAGAEGQQPDAEESATPAGAKLVITPAVVMAPRVDGIEVVWGVSQLCHGWVEWRSEDGSSQGKAAMDSFGFVPQGQDFLRVKVDGWRPGTSYTIRTITVSRDGKQREESPWKTVRTLDPGAGEIRFVVWNDTHENAATLKRLHEVTPAADFLLWNGDTCNNWTKESLLIPTLLNPAGQDITAGRPLLLTWGNHDLRGKWAFRMPGMVATPGGKPYYAFRHGPVALIFMHTGEDKPDDHPSFEGRVAFEELRREQTQWLAGVIQRPELRDAPNRILCCHIPLRWSDESAPDYANGGFDHYSRRSRDAWHDSLVKWGAQVVISGHTHQAKWLPASDEFPYAQAIGGGPQPERATWMEVAAGSERLSLTIRNLEGKVVEARELKPLA